MIESKLMELTKRGLIPSGTPLSKKAKIAFQKGLIDELEFQWFRANQSSRRGEKSRFYVVDGVSVDTELKQPPIDGLCAVTALSVLPKHQERQPICLDSWKRMGLRIVCLQQPGEMEKISSYHQVDEWVLSSDVTSEYNWPTQRINALFNESLKRNHPVLMINSDIEIYGAQSELLSARDAAMDNDQAMVGIRWNYDGTIQRSKRERWGLDAFLVSPRIASTLPDLPFGIGRPMWDYWIPLHLRRNCVPWRWIGDPYFFHESHPVHWSHEDWLKGADWVESAYNVKIRQNSWSFRCSLPFPPGDPDDGQW